MEEIVNNEEEGRENDGYKNNEDKKEENVERGDGFPTGGATHGGALVQVGTRLLAPVRFPRRG